MRTKLIVSFVVTLLAVNGVASAKSWRVSGAIVHMRQNEYEAAIKLLEEDIAESPDSAEAWAYLGDAYAHEGEFMEAAGAWSRAEEIYAQKKKKKNIEKILQSREYYWSQAFNAANRYLARALSFGNEDFVPEEGETVAGDLEKAEEGFIATYHVFSPHPKTLFLLALVYEDKATYYGELDEEEVVAVTDYDLDTGAAAQREVKAGEYVGEVWLKALDTYEAAAEAKRADMAAENWDKKTPLSDYLVKLVNAYLHFEKYEAALSIIDPLLAETPDDLELLRAKAAILDRLGRVAEAIKAYEKVAATVTDDKKKIEVLGEIASYYLREGYEGRDPKKAIEVLEEARKLAPDDYRIYIDLGRACREVGEDEKGAEYLKKGQELHDKLQKEEDRADEGGEEAAKKAAEEPTDKAEGGQ